MPTTAPKPCGVCGVLVRDGSSRCDAHKLLFTGRFGDPQRGSRHERGYGAAWTRARELVLRRDNGLCVPCRKVGRISAARDVDHIVNKAQWKRQHGTLQGVDGESNLQAICRPCHESKTAQEAASARAIPRGA